MTEYAYAENYIIKLKEGVTLASDRGYNGSLGGMIFLRRYVPPPLLKPPTIAELPSYDSKRIEYP